jgi:hypothetical protein
LAKKGKKTFLVQMSKKKNKKEKKEFLTNQNNNKKSVKKRKRVGGDPFSPSLFSLSLLCLNLSSHMFSALGLSPLYCLPTY